MAKGDVQQSPWVWTAQDYQGLVISISIYFDDTTRLLTNTGPGGRCAIVHRDTGCQYNTVVFDNPTDSAKAKTLAAPVDGAGDKGYSVAQVRNASKSTTFPNGWQTWEDTQTVQITAEP